MALLTTRIKMRIIRVLRKVIGLAEDHPVAVMATE